MADATEELLQHRLARQAAAETVWPPGRQVDAITEDNGSYYHRRPRVALYECYRIRINLTLLEQSVSAMVPIPQGGGGSSGHTIAMRAA